MKYTIEGLSQEKLISFGLDIADALILRWFLSFSGSGSMKKTVLEGKTYYLVMYKGIINDLPVLGITSTKAIGNRFDRYVEKGLLKKTILRQGFGTSLYFSPTELLISLEYNQNMIQNELHYIGPPEEKDYGENQVYLNFDEDTENSNHENLQILSENVDIFSPEEKSTSFHTENTISKGTELPFIEKNVEIRTEISQKTSKNQENSQILSEKADIFSPEEKSTSFHTENTISKGTELPFRQEPDFLSERKLDSGALNNSLTKNSNTTNSLTREVAVILKNEFSKKINPEVFSKDFWEKLILAIQNKIVLQDIPDFVKFLFDYTQDKQPKSLVNYIYKVAHKEFMLIEFKNFKTSKQEIHKPSSKVPQHECIICQTTYTTEKCPKCDFSYLDNNNFEKKEKALKIYNLPEEIKKQYFSELKEMHKKVFKDQCIDIKEMYILTHDINKKYGII